MCNAIITPFGWYKSSKALVSSGLGPGLNVVKPSYQLRHFVFWHHWKTCRLLLSQYHVCSRTLVLIGYSGQNIPDAFTCLFINYNLYNVTSSPFTILLSKEHTQTTLKLNRVHKKLHRFMTTNLHSPDNRIQNLQYLKLQTAIIFHPLICTWTKNSVHTVQNVKIGRTWKRHMKFWTEMFHSTKIIHPHTHFTISKAKRKEMYKKWPSINCSANQCIVVPSVSN